jgi:ketosteroid isomerase-like protein
MADATRDEFAALLEAWSAAIVANDPSEIDRYMTPEWVIVGQDGVTTRERFLQLVASGDLTHDMMRFEVVQLHQAPDCVVVTARGVNSGAWRGQRFEADEWVSDVFVRRDSAWRCVHSHITPALQPQTTC